VLPHLIRLLIGDEHHDLGHVQGRGKWRNAPDVQLVHECPTQRMVALAQK
jgi:hypothetical protein